MSSLKKIKNRGEINIIQKIFREIEFFQGQISPNDKKNDSNSMKKNLNENKLNYILLFLKTL